MIKTVIMGTGRMGSLIRTTAEGIVDAAGQPVFDIVAQIGFELTELENAPAADVVIDFSNVVAFDAVVAYVERTGAALVSGTISVWADVQPQLVHDMCRAYLDGDVERAREIQIAGQPLINALFSEVNPIPVKEALAQMGMIEANYRMPLCPMADDTRTALTDALKGAGLLD